VSKVRILIADDHTVFREGMRSLLEKEKDLEVVGEAGDGEEAVKLGTSCPSSAVLRLLG
jgi:NarL family two-component system response regulator LiaR